MGGLVLFITIGATLGLYGPAIPTLRAMFQLSAGDSGLLLSVHFAGAMVGILGWVVLARWSKDRTLLRSAIILLGIGAGGVALASRWLVVLAAAAIIGLGFGVLVVAVSMLFATRFGDRSAAMLNLLDACFGIGAILGPVALAATGGFRLPLLGCALLAAASLALMRGVGHVPAAAVPRRSGRPARGLLAGFVLLYVLYVGVESGVDGWEATSLVAGGASKAAAANWTAGFWAAITAGRLLAIPLALHIAPARLVAGALLLSTGALVLAHSPPLAPLAYTLTGLALAPVFPTGLAWLTMAVPSARASIALVIAGAQLGGVVSPAIIGHLIDATTPAVIPTALLMVALACLVTAVALGRFPSAGRHAP